MCVWERGWGAGLGTVCVCVLESGGGSRPGFGSLLPLPALPACPSPDAREPSCRSVRWLDRCIAAHQRPDQQNLFAIIQGGLDAALRTTCLEGRAEGWRVPGSVHPPASMGGHGTLGAWEVCGEEGGQLPGLCAGPVDLGQSQGGHRSHSLAVAEVGSLFIFFHLQGGMTECLPSVGLCPAEVRSQDLHSGPWVTEPPPRPSALTGWV